MAQSEVLVAIINAQMDLSAETIVEALKKSKARKQKPAPAPLPDRTKRAAHA